MATRDRFPRVPARTTIAQLPAILTATDSGAMAECTDLNGGSGLVRWSGTAWERLIPLTILETITPATVAANTVLGAATRVVRDPKMAVLYDGIPLFSFQIGNSFPVGWSGTGNKTITWKPTGYTGDAADLIVSNVYLIEYQTVEVF